MTRKLREKQLRDAFFMLLMKKVSNFSVPGSGKTTSVLAVYTYLKEKNGINKIIVVGPKNSFGTWIDEYNKCFENIDEARVFNVHEKNGKNNRIKKMELEYETGNKNLFLFNYESLSNYTKEIKKKLDQKTLLVFDEIHKIKKIDGQWAKKALEISENSNYIIALTGTPIPNSYLDIYNLLHILYNQEYNDFFAFTPKMLKRPNEEIINNINKRINPFFCRTTKKELGVPEVEEDIIYHVDATKNENRILKILINKYNKNKLILYLRILQLESAPQMLLESLDVNKFREILEITEDIEDIDYKDYSKEIVKLINSINITSKMKECVRKSEEIYKEGKNLIIWCIFKETMYKLNNLFQEKGIKVKIINGEVELEERENIIKNFKNKNFNILITNPHTLAESVSLHTVCHDALYFEYSYNLVHLLQSKDRIHRLGLLENQKTQYYYMQTYYDGKKFSMDKKIYERLKEKEKIMLDAIEKNILEKSTTSKEDLDIIFREFF